MTDTAATERREPERWSQADTNGIYWWRYDKDATPEPVEVRDGQFYCLADTDPTSVTIGEFLGPITPEQFTALIPLVLRLEKMMQDGPECDCPAGHMCGWPSLQREMEAARVALEADSSLQVGSARGKGEAGGK